ncbi:hypothetical protein IGI04_035629 [Brassica rapa subsp. trilocularis]|uniref:Uncharacterized protein n=1 Tax=Brassica rapa subsp. trilocularis TaxID=1813537 RepID=A0ABQ7LC83_BRACM|nr:hypothetical protein IGI04_035629 [Brassica rapa subsp. trilocularis]
MILFLLLSDLSSCLKVMQHDEECFPNGVGGGPNGGQSSSASQYMLVSSSHSKRARRSNAWDYFTMGKDENGQERAYYNGDGEMVTIRASPNGVEESGSSQRTENLQSNP